MIDLKQGIYNIISDPRIYSLANGLCFLEKNRRRRKSVGMSSASLAVVDIALMLRLSSTISGDQEQFPRDSRGGILNGRARQPRWAQESVNSQIENSLVGGDVLDSRNHWVRMLTNAPSA